MPYAISYSRFSTGVQKEGTSLDRQQTAVNAYCLQHGLTLLDTFHDAGKSGFHGKHLQQGGQLRLLLDKLQTGEIPTGTYLLVEQTDRLTRQAVLEGLNVIQQLINAGLVLVTLDDGQKFDQSTDFGQLILLLARLQRGHDESKAKSKRLSYVWTKKAEAMQDGKAPRMRYPFWLKHDGEKPVILEDAAALIHRIADLYLNGDMASDIARMLNQERISTPTGKQWDSGGITKLLQNKALIGWHQRKGSKELHQIFPAVLPIGKFNMIQTTMAARTRRRGNTQRWASALSGIAFCGVCGSPLKFTGSPTKRTAVCRAAVEGKGCDNRRSTTYKLLLLSSVLSARDAVVTQLVNADRDTVGGERDNIRQELEALDVKIKRLVQLVELTEDVQEIASQLQAANDKRKELKEALATLEPTSNALAAFQRLVSVVNDEVPTLVASALEGDRNAANRINALFHGLDNFRVINTYGLVTVGAWEAKQDGRRRIAVSGPEGEGVIVEAEDGTTYLGGGFFFLQQQITSESSDSHIPPSAYSLAAH